MTFEIFNPWDVSTSSMLDNNDSPAYKKIEELTGIHIIWYHSASANAQENFQLSIASNDYDDAYFLNSSYLNKGPDFYIENDIMVDLQPLIAEYAPNYDYVRHLDEASYLTTLTDSGYAVGISQLVQNKQWAFLGPLGRTDWLSELGLNMPRTYDEYHDVLVAFRDNYNPEAPLGLAISGLDDWLMAGYDTVFIGAGGSSSPNNFLNFGGTVRYGALESGFKDFITMLSGWYAEGLVDRDFYTRTTIPGLQTELILNHKLGIAASLYTFPDSLDHLSDAANDPIDFYGFQVPVKNVGDTRKVLAGYSSMTLNKGLFGTISTNCDSPEILLQWLDFFYTEEGARIANYGIEGEAHTVINGVPMITDLIYNNPEGRINSMLPKYATAQTQPMWYDWQREIAPGTSQAVFDTEELWDGNWEDVYTMPTITMTSEESGEFGVIMADINTYLSENIIPFIIGQRQMSEFDTMLAQINTIGIGRATEIQQAALDRYLVRGN